MGTDWETGPRQSWGSQEIVVLTPRAGDRGYRKRPVGGVGGVRME